LKNLQGANYTDDKLIDGVAIKLVTLQYIVDNDSQMTPVSTTPVPNFFYRFYIVDAISLFLLVEEKKQ
jgi:hypothetical protein